MIPATLPGPAPVTVCTTSDSRTTTGRISGLLDPVTVDPGTCVVVEGGARLTLKAPHGYARGRGDSEQPSSFKPHRKAHRPHFTSRPGVARTVVVRVYR